MITFRPSNIDYHDNDTNRNSVLNDKSSSALNAGKVEVQKVSDNRGGGEQGGFGSQADDSLFSPKRNFVLKHLVKRVDASPLLRESSAFIPTIKKNVQTQAGQLSKDENIEGIISSPGNVNDVSDEVIINSAIANNIKGSQNTDAKNLENITRQFKERFAYQAGNKEEFHKLMQQSFGDKYNKVEAEKIRQQTLQGNFSWMPKIELVDNSSLKDKSSGTQGLGAYSKSNNTVYLSRQLLNSDPVKAEKILTEEIGHAIDAKINTTDAAGDEGDIFSRLSHGEKISDSQLNELRAENDSGTIIVNGKEVEVEFGFFKKIKKGFKKAFKGIKNAFKKAFDVIKDAFIEIMQSQIFSYIMMAMQFIPIGITQVIAAVYQVAKAAYTAYLAVKNGSMAGILSAVASVAASAAGAGAAMGMSAGAVSTLNNVANAAQAASATYSAAKTGNLVALAGIAGNYVPAGSALGKGLTAFTTANSVYQGVKTGDIAGAVTAGTSLASTGFNAAGVKSETLDTALKTANQVGATADAIVDGDISRAVDAGANLAGDVTGIGAFDTVADINEGVDAARRGDIAGVANAGKDVLATGGELLTDSGVNIKLSEQQKKTLNDIIDTGEHVIDVVEEGIEVADAVKEGDYSEAFNAGKEAFGAGKQAFNAGKNLLDDSDDEANTANNKTSVSSASDIDPIAKEDKSTSSVGSTISTIRDTVKPYIETGKKVVDVVKDGLEVADAIKDRDYIEAVKSGRDAVKTGGELLDDIGIPTPTIHLTSAQQEFVDDAIDTAKEIKEAIKEPVIYAQGFSQSIDRGDISEAVRYFGLLGQELSANPQVHNTFGYIKERSDFADDVETLVDAVSSERYGDAAKKAADLNKYFEGSPMVTEGLEKLSQWLKQQYA